MMLLADCIAPNTAVPLDQTLLFKYINSFSEICEIKAVAYHDLQVSGTPSFNNLYRSWYLSQMA